MVPSEPFRLNLMELGASPKAKKPDLSDRPSLLYKATKSSMAK